MPQLRLLSFRGPQGGTLVASVVGVTMVLAVLALAVYAILLLRSQATQAAHNSADNLALALSAHASQVFSSAQYVLNGVAQVTSRVADSTQLRSSLATPAEYELLKARRESFPALDTIGIFDANGDLVIGSHDYPPTPVNIADRPGFDAARRGAIEQVHIAAPVRNRISGHWTIHMTRRLETLDNRFIGVALVSVSCEYFTRFYMAMRKGLRTPDEPESSSMTLLRSDATVLARAPFDENSLGARIPAGGPYGPAVDAQDAPAGRIFAPWDALPASAPNLVLAAHEVDGFPMQVAVALSDRVYLGAWRRQAAVIATMAAICALLLGASFAVLARVLRRREHNMLEADRLRVAAEAANLAKTEFLATISHEIRTPINGILGTAELLARSVTSARDRQLAQTLLQSSHSLLGIVSDILDLSKIEAGELQLRSVAFSPKRLVREVVALFASTASNKGLRLQEDIDERVPQAVMGDMQHLRQILGNLISNAIKFSEAGQVVLRLRLAGEEVGEDDPPTARLCFEVQDQGVGIAPEARHLLFQPFAQEDSSARRRFGGTGLGLAISQRLAHLMGSRIEFDSTPGQGSRFWFKVSFPIAEGPAAAPSSTDELPELRFAHSGAMQLSPPELPAMPHPHSGSQPHVLVVEDNAVNALVAEAQLECLDCSCDVAFDGEEALAHLRAGKEYDLVLMDCMLPRLSGYEVASLWRAEEQARGLPRLPIVALTANALATSAQQALQAGMDDFLTKPCTMDKLAAALQRWLPAGGRHTSPRRVKVQAD